ncbi:MAG: single-stranded DNA-binding protein [Saprospiraceae bacterium]|jgi:single-strand DNA-binding protein|nr:single-stranded DNA-binding protein [Saprospiraceae bacterium]MBK6478549.1 single-stranded DNA-binding protein [Saprospiraceae bacterium]MBK6814044.1 single-stranded DNA-binding protein [Saprospiraceae bacterium]MBK7373484.1 single-stranded DNA-binding protein [Saprospiraceae bacterium]MBK7437155.1 single-stranded DNA-binding protein [Saprospiraceae bacterium]
MINKVTLIGNLGRDPEIKHFEGGSSVAKFSLATNENYRDKNGEWKTETEWHDIVAWRHLAERAVKDLHKGSMVYIEGKLTHRKWQDKDGQDRYSTEIVANVLRSLEKREGGPNRGFGENFPSSESAPAHRAEGDSYQQSSKDAPASDNDDLPF